MLVNFMVGLGAMLVCLVVQALLVAIAVQFYARYQGRARSASFFSTLLLISGVMVVMVMGNFLQIFIWALLFLGLGEFDDIVVAVYHSAVNFATLGYGDIVMSPAHRILGPMQAINGVLMIGVTTAVMMSASQDALRRTRNARQQAGE
ncbi:two pore domain potassium channel family protein [Pseudohalioglobus sediminis]|uniref:Two pore domain potassium channel family protein n=1 Tax=Pseudohalioglobus sediminis TaxID=2606449 RepID=A0A5B0WQ98_9GAMM|nr:ion channel [Pseudohalioglobus sediminis]KAA1188435.1 two pore domain potassium channel family protein [Pseudohalioglobus sediminis]